MCLIYELRGAQKAVDYLSNYYGNRRIKIIVDGRRVSRGDEATYFQNKAFFTRKGLNKANVLHEFYHHLVSGLELSESRDEREANGFSKSILKLR